MRKTALLADDIVLQHVTPPGHPERPQRYVSVVDSLERAGLRRACERVAPRTATDDELAACHTHSYIETARREILAGAPELSTGDTAVSPGSLDAALRATGGTLNAVDMVFDGRAENAFCAVRPPGHHATPSSGMGFCIFNTVGIAARYAQRKYGIDRVMIVDWDVHHGNGTQDIFYHDGSVYYFSTHQWPLYPGTGSAAETGEDEGSGTTMNCPYPAGSGRAEIMGAFQKQLVPAANSFRPDLVLISAGFDSRKDDLLGQFRLEDSDFAEMTKLMQDIADKHAKGRMVSVLEGGYNLTGLGLAATAHVRALWEA